MLNDALFYNPYEIIGGVKFMSPSAPLNHSGIIMPLSAKIFNYVLKNSCGYVFTDDVDVHLPDGNFFQPDLCVITNENADILSRRNAIYGAPDMVVEVLSRSTKKRDLTVKKDSYEACGVKEYWIVDPYYRTIDVYLLRGGKFELDNEYILYKEDDVEWQHMSDEDKAAVKSEITLSIFPDLTIKLSEIFVWSDRFLLP